MIILEHEGTIQHVEADILNNYLKVISPFILELPIIKIAGNHYIMVKNGKKLNVYIASDHKHVYVFIEGKSFTFKKVDEDSIDFGESSGSKDKKQVIKAPMPGTVVKSLAAAGDIINAGDPILIVEAMKMETTLYASISGLLKDIFVKPGEQVDSDKALAVIEKEDEF